MKQNIVIKQVGGKFLSGCNNAFITIYTDCQDNTDNVVVVNNNNSIAVIVHN